MPPKTKTSTLPRWLQKELELSARRGAAEEAIASVEKALKARDEGHIPAAVRAALRAKEAAPRSAWIRELLGTLHLRAGAWREATQELLAYRRLSGDRKRDAAIAACYRNSGDPLRALTFLSELTQASVPADVWLAAQVERARSYAATGRASVGLELLRTARRNAAGAAARVLDHALAELDTSP